MGLEARLVRDGDKFELMYGSNPLLVHQPAEEPGNVTGMYAVAVYPNGFRMFEWQPAAPYVDVLDDSRGAWKAADQLMKIAVDALLARMPTQ